MILIKCDKAICDKREDNFSKWAARSKVAAEIVSEAQEFRPAK